MATLTIYWYLHTETHFFVFLFFVILEKNGRKSSPKKASKKVGQNIVPGTTFGTPKWLKIGPGVPQSEPKVEN